MPNEKFSFWSDITDVGADMEPWHAAVLAVAVLIIGAGFAELAFVYMALMLHG